MNGDTIVSIDVVWIFQLLTLRSKPSPASLTNRKYIFTMIATIIYITGNGPYCVVY